MVKFRLVILSDIPFRRRIKGDESLGQVVHVTQDGRTTSLIAMV